MMTKNYLFVSITSALLLLLVIPLLSAPHWFTGKVVSIVALSLFSVSVGGLVAETFEMAKNRSSQRNARRYFMSVLSSLLFFAIVAPSMTMAIDSNDYVDVASASALLAFSLGIGGLATDGFFALFSRASNSTPENTNSNDKGRLEHDATSENDVVDVLLGKAKLGGK